MSSTIDELVTGCISVLGQPGISPDEVEREVLRLAADPMMARRLIDWVPEAFGLVLVSHIGKVQFGNTFSALDQRGKWITIDVSREPIFAAALKPATVMFHSGPRDVFESIATRSSTLACVNSALNAGASIENAHLSGPALIGIPAEVYVSRRQSWWRRLLGMNESRN
jgi:hypothetical protein